MTDCPCTKSELDIFRPIDVQVAMTQGRWVTYYPLNPLTSTPGIVEFSIPGTANEVLDLNNISLYMRGKVVKTAPSTVLAEADKPSIVNNVLDSLIHHVDVSINGTLITRAGNDHGYKSYLQKLTQYDMPQAGKSGSQLRLDGFYMDAPGKQNDAANTGAKERLNIFAKSKEFELIGLPSIDFFQTDRALQPETDITLKFYLSDNEFLFSDGRTTGALTAAPALILSEMELNVRRVQIAPTVALQLKTDLETKDAIYPFTRREILSFGIPKDTSSVVKENLFRGHRATRFFIAMVDSEAYVGNIASSPYYFEHFNISSLCISENGSYLGVPPLRLSFKEAGGRTAWAYRLFLEQIGAIGERALSTPVSYAHWLDGSTIFAFSASPDLSHGFAQLPQQTANITLTMTFSEKTTKSITAIVMAEYDSRLLITGQKNVVTDYSI